MIRRIVFYKSYFLDFFYQQTEKVQEKIDFILDLISNVERVPEKYFKHLEGTKGLYEIRVKQYNNIYRIFCCFDEGKLVVLLNGFVKKTNKIPKNEIGKAEKIRLEYFNDKLNIT